MFCVQRIFLNHLKRVKDVMTYPLQNCCMSLDVFEYYNIGFLLVTHHETNICLI
jgi:hypothetical protein